MMVGMQHVFGAEAMLVRGLVVRVVMLQDALIRFDLPAVTPRAPSVDGARLVVPGRGERGPIVELFSVQLVLVIGIMASMGVTHDGAKGGDEDKKDLGKRGDRSDTLICDWLGNSTMRE